MSTHYAPDYTRNSEVNMTLAEIAEAALAQPTFGAMLRFQFSRSVDPTWGTILDQQLEYLWERAAQLAVMGGLEWYDQDYPSVDQIFNRLNLVLGIVNYNTGDLVIWDNGEIDWIGLGRAYVRHEVLEYRESVLHPHNKPAPSIWDALLWLCSPKSRGLDYDYADGVNQVRNPNLCRLTDLRVNGGFTSSKALWKAFFKEKQ